MSAPKAPKPSARRPWPKRGDEDINVLYMSIGRALSSWERFENSISQLYEAFVSPFQSAAARRSFNAVITFEGRADMLRASSEAYFTISPNEDFLNRFKEILSSSTQFSPRRNDIAHGYVDRFMAEGLMRQPSDQEDFFTAALYPSWASFKERDLKGKPTYCMTSDEILYFRDEFDGLVFPTILLVRMMAHDWNYKLALRDKEIVSVHDSANLEADQKNHTEDEPPPQSSQA